MSANRPVLAAGIVVWRGDEVLLIRRGKPPYKGEWSIPGGKVEHGEPIREAVLRELAEETGTRAEIVGLIDLYESITAHGHYVMADFAARWIAGEPVAGDDALVARFFPLDEALERVGWDETRSAVSDSRALIAPDSSASSAP